MLTKTFISLIKFEILTDKNQLVAIRFYFIANLINLTNMKNNLSFHCPP